jgi:hypothetical protein
VHRWVAGAGGGALTGVAAAPPRPGGDHLTGARLDLRRLPWPERWSGRSRVAPVVLVGAFVAMLLLETIRFDAGHPGARTELGTPAAVDRVRRGDVVDG